MLFDPIFFHWILELDCLIKVSLSALKFDFLSHLTPVSCRISFTFTVMSSSLWWVDMFSFTFTISNLLFVSLFWIFEEYFVIHDPPMRYIQVWCQIKDVIALIATLISVTQLFVPPDHFRLTVLLTGSRSDLRNKKIRRKERDFLYSQCEQFPDSSPESQSWR